MYKTKRRYQGEPVRTDPTCDPKENETAIHFTCGDRDAWISSHEASVVTGLLAHPDFKIKVLTLMRIKRKDSVIGVVGKLPVAALSIGPARETSMHDQIVSATLQNVHSSGHETPARRLHAPKAGSQRKAGPSVLSRRPCEPGRRRRSRISVVKR